jgi:hypothetical protein
MSIAILGGNVTIYFDNDTGGDKQLRWTGSTATTATHTVNELYTAVQDLFDNNTSGIGTYMAYGTIMRADTPRVYALGRLEINDEASWFIDYELITHLTGGSIQTVGWTRNATFRGIVKVAITSSNIVSTDVGNTITHSDGDTGTLLAVETGYLWIRPASTASTNNFDSTSGTLTCNGHTATQTAAATTGNNLWTNLFTIGTIEPNTNIYVGQDQQLVSPQYWPTGNIDRLFLINSQGSLIDRGYLSVYARKSNTLYDNFVILTTDGRNIVPIVNSPDLNNTTAGPIAANGISINFAGPYTADIDPDIIGNENYSIQINVGGNTLAYLYEYLKYVTSEGITTLFAGIEGQQYIGIDNKIDYASETGTVSIGDEITGSVSGSTAFVINKQGSYVMLANSQGTFSAGENLTIGGNSLNNISNIIPIQPKKQSPFGTFAGGRFFGAHGVYLTNFQAAEKNNYQLIDDNGNTIEEELTIVFSLTGLKDGTEIRIFEQGTFAEIAGVEDVTGGVGSGATTGVIVSGTTNNNTFAYSYTYSSNITVFIQIISTAYEIERLNNVVLSNSNQSVPVQQRLDRNYDDPNG